MNQSQIRSTGPSTVTTGGGSNLAGNRPEKANGPWEGAVYQFFCFARSKGLEPLTF